MIDWYKRFCCGIFYLLKEKAKSDIPFFATFMFTLFLFVLVFFGVDSIIYFLFKTKDIPNRFFVFCLILVFAVPNYLLVFKNKKFLDFYDKKISGSKVILLILLIFISSLSLVLIKGPRVGY